MKLGKMEINPLAAESMGVRSLCTYIKTPDISILLDASAALAYRPPHEPHPREYAALKDSLERIRAMASICDIITISHFHFDHVRPGATNYRYNFSSKKDRQELYADKQVLMKDGRSNINPSQRRRAYYFTKDMTNLAHLEPADGREYLFGDTRLLFSQPLPHGPRDNMLGFVLATAIENDESRIVFAPDVQGPMIQETLEYLLSLKPHLLIVGGPPIYLKKIPSIDLQMAQSNLISLAKSVPHLVVDHHLLRAPEWRKWLAPVKSAAEDFGHELLTMSDLAGTQTNPLEAERPRLYSEEPPSPEFMEWLSSSEEYRLNTPPPIY